MTNAQHAAALARALRCLLRIVSDAHATAGNRNRIIQEAQDTLQDWEDRAEPRREQQLPLSL